jgi:hypothetical protein
VRFRSNISSALRWLPRGSLRRPLALVAVLVAAQWLALVVFVLVVRHNGWLFFQGGDQTFYYTASWVFANGHIPKSSSVGYGWPYVLAPLSRAAGPNQLAALPAVVLLQTLVLLPVALYCVYQIAASVVRRAAAFAVAAAYIALPFLVIPLWDHSYHPEYVEQFLPQVLGLTGMGDFPSMVCLLVSALFCVRAFGGSDTDAALAGLAAGFAVGVKPANAVFLAGAFAAFLAARRWRGSAVFAAALVPAVVTLALWKYRGLGYLPIFRSETEALAAGREWIIGGLTPSRYLHFDFDQLDKNYDDLRHLFWGTWAWQFLPLLGFVAVARRSLPTALLLGGWAAAFLVVKGGSSAASIDSGSLLRLVLPGLPPLLILSALAPLVVVRTAEPANERHAAPTRPYVAIAAVVVFALLPLLLVGVFKPLHAKTTASYAEESVTVPIDPDFTVSVRRDGRRAHLVWKTAASPGVRAFYRVFRSRPTEPAPNRAPPPVRDGIRCVPHSSNPAFDCHLEMTPIREVRTNAYSETPRPGRWVYRVGLVANWRDDSRYGDLTLLSRPAHLERQR